jgi:hypothetical protein
MHTASAVLQSAIEDAGAETRQRPFQNHTTLHPSRRPSPASHALLQRKLNAVFDDLPQHNDSQNHNADLSIAPLSSQSWAPRVQRVGATLRSLVLFCCGGALLITAAMVLDPGTLLARVKSAKDDAATAQARREFTATLASLLAQCHQVLAIHHRGVTPYSEIVMWKTDTHNPGQIDPSEIAVLSHSDLLQAVTLYSLPDGVSPMSASNTSSSTTPLRFDRLALEQPGFCDRWRALPAVQPRVIGSGISDMKLTCDALENGSASSQTENHAGKLSSLRLWLRWAGDSSDATETSSVITPSRGFGT